MNRTLERLGVADELAIRSLPEVAYEKIRRAILAGSYESGQALRQEDLAHQLGISRLPVREALSRLEAEGLVVQRPRRGYIIASLDPDEIEDIFDIRAMLEERAGYLATLKRTQQDVAEVEALAAAVDKVLIKTAADVDQFAELNHAFHARLFESSGRKQLCRTMIMLRNSVERYVRVSARVAVNLDRTKAEHHQILDAFRRGQAEEVARLSRQHCEGVCLNLLARLRAERQRTDRGA